MVARLADSIRILCLALKGGLQGPSGTLPGPPGVSPQAFLVPFPPERLPLGTISGGPFPLTSQVRSGA